jgi:phage FluMu protein Com
MIIDHPTKRYEKTRNEETRAKVIQCDFCQKLAKKVGFNIDEALDAARKEGFRTKPGAKLTDPLKWACPHCIEARQATESQKEITTQAMKEGW